MRLLTGDDVSGVLRDLTRESATRLLNALAAGLAAYSRQKTSAQDRKPLIQPLRTVLQTDDGDTTLIMPVSNSSHTSVKVATVPKQGDIQGAITVYSPGGELEGVLNAAEITAFRTALATMTLLTRWNCPTQAELVVFGAGKQAEWHIRLALLLVNGVQRITAINRGRERLQKLEESVLSELRSDYPDVTMTTLAQEGNSEYSSELNGCLSNAHIICCCTPSREPLFAADALRISSQARFLSLIGSYKPEMQEIDTETLRLTSKVWVDCKEACLEEAGELIRAELKPEDLIEVGEIFASEGPSKSSLDSKARLTIFKCVGLGLMDLVTSKALLDIAERMGKGQVIENF